MEKTNAWGQIYDKKTGRWSIPQECQHWPEFHDYDYAHKMCITHPPTKIGFMLNSDDKNFRDNYVSGREQIAVCNKGWQYYKDKDDNEYKFFSDDWMNVYELWRRFDKLVEEKCG